MSVVNAWVGAATPTSARVVSKISGTSARLRVADNPGMSGPVLSPEVTGSSDDIVSLPISGLDPNTQYWWDIEVDSVVDTATTGRLKTHPVIGEPADFTFTVGNCAAGTTVPGTGAVLAADRLSNHPVFSQILNRDGLFNVHLGDLHYYDLGSGLHGISGGSSLANYRRAYDDVLLQPHQHNLYRNSPLVLLWDDHDRGPNDNDRTFAGAENASQAFRERVPSYPLPHADGIFHSFQVGRTLFICDDVRTFRDPNGDPNVAGKTMLGSAQMAWFEQMLTADNGAEFLVWLSAERAFHVDDVDSPSGNTDSWGAFSFERSDLVNMFGDLGWLDRMTIINGDFHHTGINSGDHPYGGMPIYQFATYDSSGADPSGPPPSPQLWDVGSRPGSGRYGTMRIRDTGAEITVVGTGWSGNTSDISYQFSVSADTPPLPPTPPPPPPVARAEVRTRVQWFGCRLTDGRIISELPDITGKVSRVIGDITTSGLSLPIPLSGPASLPIGLVEQATEPGRTMIVAVVNDVPTWGGIVGVSDGGTNSTLDLPVASLEAYLERRIVRDHVFTQEDEAEIAAALVGDAGDIVVNGVTLPGIGLEIDAPPTGTLRDREYLLTDRKSVFEALQELMGVINGPEWTIDLDWTDNTRTAIRKIFRVRKRIGDASASPNAEFTNTAESVFGSRTGSEAKYRYKIDYTHGHGANYVVAYSSGEGEDQPASDPAIAMDLIEAGFPVFEQHFQPSSNITSKSVLDDHAEAELDRRERGTRTFIVEARWDAYPRYGVDWKIGDDIAWHLFGHRHPPPSGVKGRGRAIGFTLDLQRRIIVPILEGDE